VRLAGSFSRSLNLGLIRQLSPAVRSNSKTGVFTFRQYIFSSHHRGPQPPSWPAFARSALADRPVTQGIGWVITARFKSNEVRVQAGIFLVDVFCLGAKSAHYDYEDCDDDYYRRRIRNHYLSRFPSPLVTKASLSTAEAPGNRGASPPHCVAFAATLWLRKLCVLSDAG
jgi:hypothetical protein